MIITNPDILVKILNTLRVAIQLSSDHIDSDSFHNAYSFLIDLENDIKNL